MKEELSQEKIEEIIKALDELLEKGPWDKSNFLNMIGKNIDELRLRFIEKTGKQLSAEQHRGLYHHKPTADEQEIYILLYSSQGDLISSWEKIVANLPRQTVSRPVYAIEKDVEALIRAIGKAVNQAYVVVTIQQRDILEVDEDKIPVDRLGKKLLTLKDNAISLKAIVRFVHQSGLYYLKEGRLVKQENHHNDAR